MGENRGRFVPTCTKDPWTKAMGRRGIDCGWWGWLGWERVMGGNGDKCN